MNPRIWRRLRRVTQVGALVLFGYLFVTASSTRPTRMAWADLFYRLDPLVALTASLAGRALIAGLALAGVTLAVTLLFGRVWCGWFCPLGTILEWIAPRRAHSARPPSERWRLAKYLLFVVVVAAALLGSQTLLFLDPVTLVSRTMATSVWPGLGNGLHRLEGFLYRFEPLWVPLDWFHNTLYQPFFGSDAALYSLAVPLFLFFAAIVALNWWSERFWCRYLCPLGGMLGLVSRFSLVRRDVEKGCAACARCEGACPTGTIDPADGYRSDPAECIVCFDCVVDCARGGVAFRWQWPGWRPAPAQPYDPGRRALLLGLGVAATGVALAAAEPITQRRPATFLRPPGADLTDFEALCIRCGECVRVCPTHGLQHSLFEGGVQNVMTPRLLPRLGACDYGCNACGEICPTGAIPPLAISEKQHTPIGLARVDRDRCLPWAYDVPCIVCEEVCPVPHKAIGLELAEAIDTWGNPITIQRPYVVKELCIGCGVCEEQCPMGGEAAIRVYAPTESGGYWGDDPSFLPRHHRGAEGA